MGTNCGPVIADFNINLNLWQNSKKTLKSTDLLVNNNCRNLDDI
jgi:hypothetical protein